VALLYSFITVLMTLTYLSLGLAYNANRVLATQSPGAIYVWQMDLVARELGLYNPAPTLSVSAPVRLPAAGQPYYLVIRAAQLAQVDLLPGRVEPVAQGRWVVDKTGLLPRMLQLARGTEPPEDIRMEWLVPLPGVGSVCEWKGPATYFDIVVPASGDAPGRTARRAAWAYPRPTPAFAAIAGYVAVYPALMDRCTVDGATARPQDGGFYGGWITPDVAGPFKGGPGTSGW
jgi:hypothetical protein